MFECKTTHNRKSSFTGLRELALNRRFRNEISGYASSAPTTDGTLYIGSDDHRLYAIGE